MPNSQHFRAFESRMARVAAERSMPLARYRRLVGFAVLIETLAEAVAQGRIPLFFVKGGVAMELRLGLAARATKDIDIGLCLPAEQVVPAFDAAIAVGYGDFRLRRQGEARVLDNGARQLRVRIDYLENPFATVDVDLASASTETDTETIAPFVLEELDLTAPRDVPCLAITEQIAQKVHATTEPTPRGRPNMRFRDIIDIVLLNDRMRPDPTELNAACARVFAMRQIHAWPIIEYPFPAEWADALSVLAQESGYDTVNVAEIQRRFNAFLTALNAANAQTKQSRV
jgi:hypothetical protein